jgi:hypothetical protein
MLAISHARKSLDLEAVGGHSIQQLQQLQITVNVIQQ